MYNKLFALCILIVCLLTAYLGINDRNEGTVTMERKETEAGQEQYRAANTSFYENRVAITFDDGPHPENTKILLDGLKERNVKATFFLLGEKIKGNEELVIRMNSEGHLIGNHTYSHVNLAAVNEECAIKELDMTNKLLYDLTGKKVKYVRPPYGEYTDELEEHYDLSTVLWSVDPRDWEIKNTDEIVKNVLDNVGDGDIILLHDIYSTSVSAALKIIDELKYRGYVFVTVDEILLD